MTNYHEALNHALKPPEAKGHNHDGIPEISNFDQFHSYLSGISDDPLRMITVFSWWFGGLLAKTAFKV